MNDSWKSESGSPPTPEDVVKYKNLQTNLLVGIDCFALPQQCLIMGYTPDKEFVQFGTYMGSQWVARNDLTILHVGADSIRKIVPKPKVDPTVAQAVAELKDFDFSECSGGGTPPIYDEAENFREIFLGMFDDGWGLKRDGKGGWILGQKKPTLWQRIKNFIKFPILK